ncbi:deoxyribodipyrimidine photo-lyase [Ornithobacterium rhinotracheale H06-030791]|uniref:Deoxyribodipyrimidine photolyase n=4 Tax=Ornithobacterium rhinotracheale TaxID=28251 RepID=I4A2E6_ORNRL|nr:deoxyribodipyrimidine photolyase [Ornithobacterium rhinotracheale DSM 15997]AIP99888.1 deoxyribodipyrimidine photo-lyase [Ornithobacterium rhinotracheale ORT-UMN 88]KGB66065.1 deoxyribodipyrimidine photo-lyase [Ornithobacterium rhinotracheale H06-030791]
MNTYLDFRGFFGLNPQNRYLTHMKDYVIHWFRRDLRLKDNTALHHAIQHKIPVKCIFIFDTEILKHLPKQDKRVGFILQQLLALKKSLRKLNSDLLILKGNPSEIWKDLAQDSHLKAVFTNRDYEPYALQRDEKVQRLLTQKNIEFHTFKDQIIFEKNEVLTQAGEPYKVYTPYKNQWKKILEPARDLKAFPIALEKSNFYTFFNDDFETLESIGFENVEIPNLPTDLQNINIDHYEKERDLPYLNDGTSKLGTALRFGTLSIREAMRYAMQHNETFWNELIWREFFSQVLGHYPEVVSKAFKPKYDFIAWRNNEQEFELWCQGKTGVPIVDAGLRELNATGFMHNRVRMIVGSFLVKNLLIDWRWGEAYFAEKLMDFDLASNNGNWQWVAGCGTDAAPYFRVFNPITQAEKFDPNQKYIKKWIPEWGTAKYPEPMVDLKSSRLRCLEVYKKAVKSS